MKEPIFIIGCPRSGTTLLARMLEPTSYGKPVESHFITKYYKQLSQYGDLSQWKNFNALLTSILRERPVQQWNLNIDLEKFYRGMEEFHYSEIVNKLCLLRAKTRGRAAWGDKTPNYLFDLDILDQLFPDAKYIYIVRDGRDVALSILQKPWGPNNIYCCAEYWEKCNNKHKTVLDKLTKNRQLYPVKYENLIHDPNKIIASIYDFLCEPYDSGKITPLIAHVNKENCNRWKTIMTPHQVRIFESIAEKTLNRFGYETTYHKSKGIIPLAFFYHLHNQIHRKWYLFKLNTIDTIKIKLGLKEPFTE
ncbi:MAG: sulfotransferase [Deltaproteobacteria bacterium]|nr:sulfotransferase [Deltaproteobacteria bacterium]